MRMAIEHIAAGYGVPNKDAWDDTIVKACHGRFFDIFHSPKLTISDGHSTTSVCTYIPWTLYTNTGSPKQ